MTNEELLKRIEVLEKSREITIRQIDKLFHELDALKEQMTNDREQLVYSDTKLAN